MPWLKMRTVFRVQSARPIRDKKRFVILGEVLEGVLKIGMNVSVPLNRGVNIQGKVAAIETVCRDRACDSGFSIECDSDEELDVWVALNIGEGEELLLSEDASSIR